MLQDRENRYLKLYKPEIKLYTLSREVDLGRGGFSSYCSLNREIGQGWELCGSEYVNHILSDNYIMYRLW